MAIVVAAPAWAQQWTAVRLHPNTALFSEVNAVGPGIQAGTLRDSSPLADLPVLWHGSSASWSPLASGAGLVCNVLGLWGTTQVGYAGSQAALWHGTPDSYVNLRPTQFSEAHAVRGTMQVGYAFYDPPGEEHAALWRGTAASYIDLHPASAVRSFAYATDGMLQGGEAWVGAGPDQHAALWNGTAASFTDLSGGRISTIRGMAAGIQVGWTYAAGAFRAAVWRGSTGSFQDFNGPQLGSRFLATTGSLHVGDSGSGTFAHAYINFGAPDAWLDLHQFLPPGYSTISIAKAVYQDGATIYVGGYAVPDGTAHQEAFLWIGTAPCYANCDQATAPPLLNVLDFACYINRFGSGDGYANCDNSTTPPLLNILDFACFLNRFAAGCS
jgi:hypothetical protein